MSAALARANVQIIVEFTFYEGCEGAGCTSASIWPSLSILGSLTTQRLIPILILLLFLLC